MKGHGPHREGGEEGRGTNHLILTLGLTSPKGSQANTPVAEALGNRDMKYRIN